MAAAGGSIVAALLLLAAVAVHKGGHAAAYRDLGIGRAVVRWGLPLPPRLVRQPTPERPYATVVTPWLVTGHVTPAVPPERAGELPYPDLALYACGGVIASLAAGCGLIAAWGFFTGTLVPALGWGAACAVLWGGRRVVAAVLCPAAAVVLLGTEVWALTGGLHMEVARGPGGLLVVHTFAGALFTAGVFSLTAGVFSMLPFPQFDGGHMLTVGLGLWRGQRSAAVYEAARSCVLIAVIVVAVFTSVLGVLG
jgi:hypothetical protein